ncbi:hypothetical protein CWI38_0223p0050 [Hamiltosporidium tvaerminnensis]|uniref:Uncharacterized protein n=1 Tax=Hamiltosporidium tvaerminnensis TaxID=1176355 RepID=A0A4Q9M1Y0_9MICR|nr:hypothetical protein CWI38_0223p0050 [Hamiltosporidium tvaerminnensis]
MRYNSQHFLLDEETLYADSDTKKKLLPKSRIEKAWDELSDYYAKRLEDTNRDIIESTKLSNKISQARLEMETYRSVDDLISQNILKEYICAEKPVKNLQGSIKPKICKMCISIADKYLKIFDEAVECENKINNILSKYNRYCSDQDNYTQKSYKIILSDGFIKIFVTQQIYILLNKNCEFIYPEKWLPTGLSCIIQYDGFVFKGSLKPQIFNDAVENVREYCEEREIILERKRGKLKIIIYQGFDTQESELCTFVLKSLKRKTNLDKIIDLSLLYLSKLFTFSLYRYIDVLNYEFINFTGPVLDDGHTEMFFCVSSSNKLRILRDLKKGNFEIHWNERKMIPKQIL